MAARNADSGIRNSGNGDAKHVQSEFFPDAKQNAVLSDCKSNARNAPN
jgi:hypothetical protein